MMRLNELAVAMAVAAITATTAQAGGGQEGNGGGVHYCPGREQKVRLYDLYEGKYARNKDPIPVFESAWASKPEMEAFAIAKLKRFNLVFGEKVAEQLEVFHGSIEVVNKNLRKIPDANYLWTDPDCTYEQLANWSDLDQKVYVSKFFSELMKSDPLSEVAFGLHEAIYKASRLVHDEIGFPLQDSDRVRTLVAYLFSDLEIPVTPELRRVNPRGPTQVRGSSGMRVVDVPYNNGSAEYAVEYGGLVTYLGKISAEDLKTGSLRIRYRIPLLEDPSYLAYLRKKELNLLLVATSDHRLSEPCQIVGGSEGARPDCERVIKISALWNAGLLAMTLQESPNIVAAVADFLRGRTLQSVSNPPSRPKMTVIMECEVLDSSGAVKDATTYEFDAQVNHTEVIQEAFRYALEDGAIRKPR